MDEQNLKEVRYDQWCKKCKHEKLDEFKDPCNECLDTPVNDGSVKPIKFEEPD